MGIILLLSEKFLTTPIFFSKSFILDVRKSSEYAGYVTTWPHLWWGHNFRSLGNVKNSYTFENECAATIEWKFYDHKGYT